MFRLPLERRNHVRGAVSAAEWPDFQRPAKFEGENVAHVRLECGAQLVEQLLAELIGKNERELVLACLTDGVGESVRRERAGFVDDEEERDAIILPGCVSARCRAADRN